MKRLKEIMFITTDMDLNKYASRRCDCDPIKTANISNMHGQPMCLKQSARTHTHTDIEYNSIAKSNHPEKQTSFHHFRYILVKTNHI